MCRTFQWLWRAVAANLESYAGFPRLVGECGGKNYHFVHPSAHLPTVIASTIRSAFEYQVCSVGQKRIAKYQRDWLARCFGPLLGLVVKIWVQIRAAAGF